MIVGALRDCGEITGAASDVKGDVYVCRVLGRTMLGRPTDPETAVRLAAQLHPADPWQLDAPLWYIGKTYCYASSPDCSPCYLAPHCAFSLGAQRTAVVKTGGVKAVPKVSQQMPVSGGRATTGGYQFALQTVDGHNVLVDGRATFGYYDVEHYGQLALVSLSLSRLFSVAKNDGRTKSDGAWKAGRTWKVPTPRYDRIAELAREAKSHSFVLV